MDLEDVTAEPFDSGKSSLKVIETSQFIKLCHLNLCLHVGTDKEIKQHLAIQMSLLNVSILVNLLMGYRNA